MKKLLITGASALVLFSVIYTVSINSHPVEARQDGAETARSSISDSAMSNSESEEANTFSQEAFTAEPATPPASASATPKATPKATQKSTPQATQKATAKAPASTPKATATSTTSGTASKIIATAKNYLGVPYVWGGSSPSGFDCSGFIHYVYNKHGISLPRVSADQYKAGTSVSKSNLRPGDLIFFETYKPGPSHVGIYLGNNQFIHASSGAKKVMISDLTSSYYTSHYIGARRVIK